MDFGDIIITHTEHVFVQYLKFELKTFWVTMIPSQVHVDVWNHVA